MRARSFGPVRLTADTHRRVRVPKRVPAALLLIVGIVAGIAIHAPAGYAEDNGNLTVSPGRGGPQAEFAVQYKTRKRSNACFPLQITFTWDGSPLGRATPTLTGRSCVATLQTAPPPGADSGTHTISAAEDPSARARYTLTGNPGGNSSVPTPTAIPEDTATEAPVDSADPVDPASAQATAFAAPPGGPTPTVSADGERDTGSGVVPWLIAFGVVLFLVGSGVFGLSIRRAREPEADTDTQVLPLVNQTARRPAHRARRLSFAAGRRRT